MKTRFGTIKIQNAGGPVDDKEIMVIVDSEYGQSWCYLSISQAKRVVAKLQRLIDKAKKTL